MKAKKKTAASRGARKRVAAPLRPSKWVGDMPVFPQSIDPDSVDRWIKQLIHWADLNKGNLLYKSYASMIGDAACKCMADVALWNECGTFPRNLVAPMFNLSQVAHWVHLFWAGVPSSIDQKRAGKASAEVRSKKRTRLISFASESQIPLNKPGKIYAAARKAGVIKKISGKDYVVDVNGNQLGSALPDTQSPLKDILRKKSS